MPRAFQSPSLRGSGRFRARRQLVPLRRSRFQSPSLRGSGRFRSSAQKRRRSTPCFNPLHCGAVVASAGRKEGGPWTTTCFNPLHCGAVVASQQEAQQEQGRQEVSIPFIAGQWSLHTHDPDAGKEVRVFQSPSLRGSGRFSAESRRAARGARVSIPFIAGQWSLPEEAGENPVRRRGVSIPFIAGQWSLRPRTTPSSLFGVLLRNTRPACDHVLCARLHVWPKPVIIP